MKTKFGLIALAVVVAFLFVSCKDKPTDPVDEFAPSLKAQTKVIAQSIADQFSATAGTDSIIVMPNVAETQQLAIGNIIVSTPTDEFPHGLLRKITQLTPDGNNLIATTEPASLTDALQSGSLSINRALSPADLESTRSTMKGVVLRRDDTGLFNFDINSVLWDMDGNPNTTNDQAKLEGTASIDLGFEGQLRIKNGALHNMSFVANEKINMNVTMSNSVSFFNVNQDITIFSQPFRPLVFSIGVFPVVITPVMQVKLNLSGNATASVSLSYSYSNQISAGVQYADNAWQPVNTITEQATSTNVDPLAYNINYKASLNPGLSFLFYGLAGVSVSAGVFGEVIIDPAIADWWTLWAGFHGNVAIDADIFSDIIDTPEPWQIFNTRFLVQKATNPIQGTLRGRVKDAVSTQGIAGVSINVYNDLITRDLIASSQTESDGSYSFSVNAGTEYRVTFSKTGYHEVTYNNVNIPGNQETILQTIMQIDETYVGTGTISGFIYNALTSYPVEGVTLYFRQGWNTQAGAVLSTAVTNSSGAYSLSDLLTGYYTAEASKAEYNTTYFNVVVVGGITSSGQNGVITPLLSSDEIRIVLTWGASPSDLDSHITGPDPSGGRFHVYYSNRNFYHNSEVYCNLDVDDTSSYGPETVTISHQTGGLYRYSVHDFTNRNSTTSQALSNSGATVRVYFGSLLVQTFYVPTATVGTLWTVFEMYDNQIVPQNLMTNESSPGSITKNGKTDAKLMQNLPKK